MLSNGCPMITTGRTPPGRHVGAVLLAGLFSLTSSVAHADAGSAGASDDRVIAWSVTATELATVGAFALHAGTGLRTTAPMLVLDTALVLGLGTAAGLAANRWDLDARAPLAIHGAGWYGLPMFLLGTLVDGRDTRYGSRVGAAAYVLGAAGVVGGLVVGSRVDSSTDLFALLGAPVGGFLAGGVFLGLPLMLVASDSDEATGRLITGAVIGAVFGIGIATYLALRHEDHDVSIARTHSLPMVDVAPGRVAVSFGGAF